MWKPSAVTLKNRTVGYGDFGATQLFVRAYNVNQLRHIGHANGKNTVIVKVANEIVFS